MTRHPAEDSLLLLGEVAVELVSLLKLTKFLVLCFTLY